MTNRLRKLLLPLLRAVKEGRPISFRMRSAASQGIFLIGKPTSKSKKERLRRGGLRATKNEETAKIREAVFKRAGDRCEAGWCRNPAAELDHWLSGSGRRTARQSVETCWALCADDHRFRTRNAPSAAFWNTVFREHCERHGYPVIEHIVHEPVGRATP